MKAIVQDTYGPSEVLRLEEVLTPVVKDGARTGEAIPPCGVPATVGWNTDLSMNPAASHLRKVRVSIGMVRASQS